VTDALPLLVAIGGDCADDASIDACVTGAFCTVGICLTDAPVINSISANRTSLDAATVTLRVGDALSNVNGLVFTALNSRGDVLGTLASDTVAQDGPFSTFFKELTGLSAYPSAAAIGVDVLDATGNSTPTNAAIPSELALGDTCRTALDLCGGGNFCATITGAPVCSSHAPAVTTLTVETAADLRSFTLTVEGFDADADITQLDVTYSLDGDSASTTTYTVADGDFAQEADGTVSFTTEARWDIVQMGQFNLISAKFTDAAAFTGSRSLAYGDFAPLVPSSDCDPAGRACGAGLYCDSETAVCTFDSAAACGMGVDVAPLESGISDGAGGYSLTGLVTPISTAAALGDCGSDGDETAIVFAVGSGDWNVVVTSPDAVFVTVVEGYCAIATPAVCEPTTGGQFSTVISTSAATAKYLLVESATPGLAATVDVVATPFVL
jgi:hypothetical protein